MFTTNECFVRKCPILYFNCRYPFSTKVNICSNSETMIKRFIMFLNYSRLHIKFLKYQLLIYSLIYCEKILVSQMVFLIFLVVFSGNYKHCTKLSLLFTSVYKKGIQYLHYFHDLILIIHIQFD